MDQKVVLLSGAPASGKDTVTSLLTDQDKRIVHFPKHRSCTSSDEPKEGYINVSTPDYLNKLYRGDFLQSHSRYGRNYGVDKKILGTLLKKGDIPVLHVGRLDNFYELQTGLNKLHIPFVHILLWCSPDATKERLMNRESSVDEANRRTDAAKEELTEHLEVLESRDDAYDLVVHNVDANKTGEAILTFLKDNATKNQIDSRHEYLNVLRASKEAGLLG